MRKMMILLIVIMMLIPGTALAISYTCSNAVCLGTENADQIRGTARDQVYETFSGPDTIQEEAGSISNPDHDEIYSGAGNDIIKTQDRGADFIDCGEGFDTLDKNLNDTDINCETVS